MDAAFLGGPHPMPFKRVEEEGLERPHGGSQGRVVVSSFHGS